ncbi:MAG: hypothetical protein ACOYW8_02270 [Bacillota bacterium]
MAILLALVLFLVSASYAEARQAVFAIGSTSYAVDGETRTIELFVTVRNHGTQKLECNPGNNVRK